MRTAIALSLALSANSLQAIELPFGIESIRKVEDGVSLRFKRNQFWKFSHSNGDSGIIGLTGVSVFERKGVELVDSRAQEELALQMNDVLSLSDHHTRCSLNLTADGGRLSLKASGAFSYPGLSATSFETTVYP
jgi:hypothetical protein